MSLELVTAGESHGPALAAVLTGLPAGLTLDRGAIDEDLRRRREGYGRSPRQKFEHELGTPLALVIRNRDHENWAWGMSPWPPESEPRERARRP